MSIQMDTWIDSSNVEQWKQICRRKLSKGMQCSKAWKASCIIFPTTSRPPATSTKMPPSQWANSETGPPPLKLFSYFRTEHRHSTYRQIRILSWHISVEHTNRNLCIYKETSSPAEAKSGKPSDDRCRNKQPSECLESTSDISDTVREKYSEPHNCFYARNQ